MEQVMQLLTLVGKFFLCLTGYLFWGKSLAIGIAKLIGWAVFVLALSLKSTDTLKLTTENGDTMLSLEAGYWVLASVSGLFVAAAVGASCVRVKSLVFRVGKELELDMAERIFRLPVNRWGCLVDIQAPPVKVQKAINANGESILAAVPFELVWSHQSEPGKRPIFSGRGPLKVDVLMIARPSTVTCVPFFPGLNGNRLGLHVEKGEKVWIELSVGSVFTRWFSMEQNSEDIWIGFHVLPEHPPKLPGRLVCKSFDLFGRLSPGLKRMSDEWRATRAATWAALQAARLRRRQDAETPAEQP
jgi:hypothetical protein